MRTLEIHDLGHDEPTLCLNNGNDTCQIIAEFEASATARRIAEALNTAPELLLAILRATCNCHPPDGGGGLVAPEDMYAADCLIHGTRLP